MIIYRLTKPDLSHLCHGNSTTQGSRKNVDLAKSGKITTINGACFKITFFKMLAMLWCTSRKNQVKVLEREIESCIGKTTAKMMLRYRRLCSSRVLMRCFISLCHNASSISRNIMLLELLLSEESFTPKNLFLLFSCMFVDRLG